MSDCKIGVIGVGQRGCAYIKLAMNTDGAVLTALCDSDSERMLDFAVRLGCQDIPRFTDFNEMLASDLVDAVIITVPDFQHAATARAALRRGKHVMLEKPMAPTADECRQIIMDYSNSNAIMQLGFVLREHPLYKKIKETVESGKLGQIMSVSADEAIGVMHGASYMRRWHRKTKNSGGFMLAKCSHDLDLLSWIIDSVPVRVASFGSIDFFKAEKQVSSHCSQCPELNCRFRFKGEMVVMSDQEKANPSERDFDLCVYNKDKDIVDNQVSILEYANGVKASFSLKLFAPAAKRTMEICGTEGYLEADTESGLIKISYSTGLPEEKIECISSNSSGHGGSDLLFFKEFLTYIKAGKSIENDFDAGLVSTITGNAIEKSRLSGKTIDIPLSSYQL
jgi:predicted dehydrogenase